MKIDSENPIVKGLLAGKSVPLVARETRQPRALVSKIAKFLKNREMLLVSLLSSANEEIATLREQLQKADRTATKQYHTTHALRLTVEELEEQLEAAETAKDQLADALGKVLGASPTASVESLVEAALKQTAVWDGADVRALIERLKRCLQIRTGVLGLIDETHKYVEEKE
jgi:ElaB/YqjD/DUF883 family membrane-anchored ribosome-binding protein